MTKFEARVKNLLEGAVQIKSSGGLPGMNANNGMQNNNGGMQNNNGGMQNNNGMQNGQNDDKDVAEFTGLLAAAASNQHTPEIDAQISKFSKRRPDLFKNLGNSFKSMYPNNGGI